MHIMFKLQRKLNRGICSNQNANSDNITRNSSNYARPTSSERHFRTNLHIFHQKGSLSQGIYGRIQWILSQEVGVQIKPKSTLFEHFMWIIKVIKYCEIYIPLFYYPNGMRSAEVRLMKRGLRDGYIYCMYLLNFYNLLMFMSIQNARGASKPPEAMNER